MVDPLTIIKGDINRGIDELINLVKDSRFTLHYGICSSLLYISSTLLASHSAIHTLTFIHIGFVTSYVVKPIFAYYLEPYHQVTLVPLIGQVCIISTSSLIANIGCILLFWKALGIHQIILSLGLFAVCNYSTNYLTPQIRQLLI